MYIGVEMHNVFGGGHVLTDYTVKVHDQTPERIRISGSAGWVDLRGDNIVVDFINRKSPSSRAPLKRGWVSLPPNVAMRVGLAL